jgi:solute carrier family 13 (sodium-dependent dicarboxylate transporter), member 2/3/5
MNDFIKKYKKELAFVIGILFFALIFGINPFSLMPKANLVLSIAALMIMWWVL